MSGDREGDFEAVGNWRLERRDCIGQAPNFNYGDNLQSTLWNQNRIKKSKIKILCSCVTPDNQLSLRLLKRPNPARTVPNITALDGSGVLVGSRPPVTSKT